MYSERSESHIDNKYRGDPDPLMGLGPRDDTYITAAFRHIVCAVVTQQIVLGLTVVLHPSAVQNKRECLLFSLIF